jgi:hypothetical protein
MHPFLENPPPPPPKEYAHLHEEKHGYVNYRYNRLEVERLLKQVANLGDFSDRTGLWTWTGKQGEQVVQFKLAGDAVAARIGEAFSVQPLDGDAEPVDQPQGTGGLLMALHHFRQLLTDPRAYFTEFYYLGSEPGDDGERVDVLIATRGLTTSRFYFSRPDTRLIGFDFHLSEIVDPCEIRFSEQHRLNERALPRKWTIRQGDQQALQFTLEDFQLEGATP